MALLLAIGWVRGWVGWGFVVCGVAFGVWVCCVVGFDWEDWR